MTQELQVAGASRITEWEPYATNGKSSNLYRTATEVVVLRLWPRNPWSLYGIIVVYQRGTSRSKRFS